MAAGPDDRREGAITGINVTPMVDVVLVLLIIFMATAPMIAKRALEVSVPKSAQGTKKATATLQVYYTADRKVVLGSEEIAPEALEAALASSLRMDPGLHVSVAADKSIPYGDVVGLLDVVRKAGVKKVALDVSAR
jgi:biopolymer transport protein ExbD